MLFSKYLFLLLPTIFCFQDEDNKNTEKPLNGILNRDNFRVVLFYSPWLDSCKETIQIFDEFKSEFEDIKDVNIEKIDIYENRKIASRFKVNDYCEVKFFIKGSVVAERYEETVSVSKLKKFTKKASKKILDPTIYSEKVVELTDDNFRRIVGDTNKTVLVLFYTTFSKKCDHLRKTINNVGERLKRNVDCVLAQVNVEKHYDVAIHEEVGIYPTFKFYSKSNKDGEIYLPGKYDENWSEKNITKFLFVHCGIHGTLNEPVDRSHGRINVFDAQAKRFIKEHTKREEIFRKTFELAQNAASYRKNTADIYVKIMESIKLNGESWINKEINRIDKMMLKFMLEKDRDHLQKRKNILTQFLYKVHDEL